MQGKILKVYQQTNLNACKKGTCNKAMKTRKEQITFEYVDVMYRFCNLNNERLYGTIMRKLSND
jgi:hypothetical protein